jgi:hypothetical protein
MHIWIVKKFWARVEQCLLEKKNITFEDNSIYVQFAENKGIYLHPNGQGFVCRPDFYSQDQLFDGRVYIPDHILQLTKGLINGN